MTQSNLPGLEQQGLSPIQTMTHIRVEAGRCRVCCLDPDLCTGVPSRRYLDALKFIEDYGKHAHKGWSFAKTMAAIPHEYAVRVRAQEAMLEPEFDDFIEIIREYGYSRKPPRMSRTFRYVNVDGWRYWTMRKPSETRSFWHTETSIINRAPLTEEDQEALRRANGYNNARWYECDAGHHFALVVESLRPEDAFACPACGHHAEIHRIAAPA